MSDASVRIDYTNHRGQRGIRLISPIGLKLESNEFHPETQWILYAIDLDKNSVRGFAMKDIHSWGGPLVTEREKALAECEALVGTYARPGRFTVSDSWRDDMTASEIYETGVIDVSGWLKDAIAALRKGESLTEREKVLAECEAIARPYAPYSSTAAVIADAIAALGKGDGK